MCLTPMTFETTKSVLLVSLADPGIYLGETTIPNRKLRAKPESKCYAPENRVRSPSQGREPRDAPRIEGQ